MTKAELRRAREQLGMTQRQLAEAIGMRETSIARMENGFQRIMRTTQLSVKYLLLTMSKTKRGKDR